MRIPATETRGGVAHLTGQAVFPNVQCGCCGFWRPRAESSYYVPEETDPDETITAGFYCDGCWGGLEEAGLVHAGNTATGKTPGLAQVG
jgi:hypothetical protein